MIEDFYTPEKEFIYFNDFDELDDILQDVDDNFENYVNIIEAGYKRSLDYTVEKIYRYIQTNDESLITWRNKHV